MSFDGKAFGEEIVAAVKAHVDRELSPILERLERADGRFDRIDQRIDAVALRGQSAGIDENMIVARATEALGPIIEQRVQSAVAAMPAPKSITVDDVRPLIEQEVAAAVARLRPAEPAYRAAKSMMINRCGALIVEIGDGEFENLGCVVEHHTEEFSFDDAIALGVRALPPPRGIVT